MESYSVYKSKKGLLHIIIKNLVSLCCNNFQVIISLMHTRHSKKILISSLKTLTNKEVTSLFVVTMQSRLPVFRARFVETTRCLCAYKIFIHPRFYILYRVPPYRITSLCISKTYFWVIFGRLFYWFLTIIDNIYIPINRTLKYSW